MKKKLTLTVRLQGIMGKTMRETQHGMAQMVISKNDCPEIYIKADIFTGSGNDYKMRDESEITISFAGYPNTGWRGTATELRVMLEKFKTL